MKNKFLNMKKYEDPEGTCYFFYYVRNAYYVRTYVIVIMNQNSA